MSALALGGAGWWAVRTVDPAGALAPAASSIAVLPFADMSVEGDQAYLGDGVAEEILNILAGVDSLQVAARTSSFAFRENDDIRDIGSRLDVAHILEGSVRRAGSDVRITAQLIDTRTGFHLWSETYDREMDDLFAVQDEIAGSIAEAYAGLADSWALMPQFVGSVDPAEAMERAEKFALDAIELNDDLAEAHASLGLVRALRQDRIGALASLGRAIELNGSYAPALHWRGNVLAEMGRLDDALDDARRAASVDPLSPAIASDLGRILLWSGDLEGAEAEFERAQSLDFGYAPSLLGAAMVALEQEQEVGPRMALTQWAAVSGLPAPLAVELSTGMLRFRQTGEPQPVPAELTASAEGGLISSGTAAALHARLGAEDATLRWLWTSLEDRSWVDQYLRVNPAYDPVRGMDGFREILEQVGG